MASSKGCIIATVIIGVFMYCKNKQINLKILIRKYNNKQRVNNEKTSRKTNKRNRSFNNSIF